MIFQYCQFICLNYLKLCNVKVSNLLPIDIYIFCCRVLSACWLYFLGEDDCDFSRRKVTFDDWILHEATCMVHVNGATCRWKFVHRQSKMAAHDLYAQIKAAALFSTTVFFFFVLVILFSFILFCATITNPPIFKYIMASFLLDFLFGCV